MKYLFRMMVLLLLANIALQAQEATEGEFSTPSSTITYCKEIMSSDDLNYKEMAVILISDKNDEKKEKLAQKFIKYLEAHSLFFDPQKAPTSKGYLDSTEQKNRFYPFEKEKWIYLEKINEYWLISEETVDNINNQYKNSKLIAASSFSERLPQGNFLGLKVWQWLGLLLYILVGFILYKILTIVLHRIVVVVFGKLKLKHFFDKYIIPLAKPMSIALVIFISLVTYGVLQLPQQLALIFSYGFKITLAVLITVFLFRSCNIVGAILARGASKTESSVDDQLVPLLIKILKAAVVVVGVIYIASAFGISIAPLVAGASIGGLALAMAAQDTVRNLFGSFTMFTDQPFEVGDWIKFNGNEGSVEEVGIRSTRIRTFYDSLISVPNGELANAVIDNMGRRTYRRYVATLGVTYDTNPDAIDAFVIGLQKLTENHPKTRDYYQIHLNDFGASAIEILYYVFFNVNDWTEELETRHQLISDIIKLAKTLDVRFAYPTQTLHIEEIPGRNSLTPPYSNSPASLQAKNEAFLQQNREKYKNWERTTIQHEKEIPLENDGE